MHTDKELLELEHYTCELTEPWRLTDKEVEFLKQYNIFELCRRWAYAQQTEPTARNYEMLSHEIDGGRALQEYLAPLLRALWHLAQDDHCTLYASDTMPKLANQQR